MKVKVHWIIDGTAEIEADSLEAAEQEVHTALSEFLTSNPHLSQKFGARALQGKAYLPGSAEDTYGTTDGTTDGASESTSTTKNTKLTSLAFLTLVFLAAQLFPLNTAMAAGRTYEPKSDDYPKPRLELCRLKALERTPEGNKCVYKRQSGGLDKVINIENSTQCQKEFQCKRLD